MSQAPVCTAQADQSQPGRVTLRNVRVAYADGLNAAKAGKPDPVTGKTADPKWSAVFLIPERDTDALNVIQGVMWGVAQAKWADKAGVVWQALQASNKLALKSGATKADQDGFLGHYFVSGGNGIAKPPTLLSSFAGPDGAPAVLPRPQAMIYSGCYVNVQLDFWPQDNDHGKRINCEIKVVQFAADGQSFGGGAAADTSVFSAVQAPMGGAPAGVGAFGAAPGGFGAPQQPGFPQQGAAPQMPGFPAQTPGMPQQGFAPGAQAPQQQPQFQQPGFPQQQQQPGFPQQQPQFPQQQPQFQQPQGGMPPAQQGGFAPSMTTNGPAFSGGGAPQGGFPQQQPANPGSGAGYVAPGFGAQPQPGFPQGGFPQQTPTPGFQQQPANPGFGAPQHPGWPPQ